MAGGKLTPRQKMINMMYLVLTALLALNVSTEVLNAFKLVNDGLGTSNNSLESKNDGIYKAFAKASSDDAGKAKEWADKATKAKQISDDLKKYLEDRKKKLIEMSGGRDKETGEIEQRDNIDNATIMFVEQNGKGGKELREKILEARKQLLALCNNELQLPLDAPMPVGAPKGTDWEFATFNHVPATAAVTILTKFQNDVISSEGAVIEYLYKKIGAFDFKFDNLTAAVISPSGYVLQGQTYKAEIFVAASSSTQNPEVFLGGLAGFEKDPAGGYKPKDVADESIPLSGGQKLEKVVGGKGQYETTGSGVGEKKYSGAVRLKNPKGGYTFYPFEASYQVGAKAVVISPTKMNVLYIGVDNPMEISVPGVSANDITASLQGAGTLRKDGNGYVANVTQVGTCKIPVSAKIEGKVTPMGEKEFRIKRIPDPVPSLGGKLKGGNTQAGTIKAQSGVVAALENFDFDARFSVVSFQMVYSSKGEIFKSETQGPLFNTQMKSFLDRAKPKDIIFIDEIKVVGPDKSPRKLGQIAFQII